MSFFSKKLLEPRLAKKLVWGLITLIVSLLVISFTPSVSHIGMVLTGEAQGQQKIEFFYLEGPEAKSMAFRDTLDLRQSYPYYFSYPRHFSPDRIVIDLGAPPSTWAVEDVVVRVDFLLFGFDGYHWELPVVESLVRPIEASTLFQLDEKFHINAIKEPARLTFNLDYSKAKPTTALVIAKFVCILLIVALIKLLTSGYFWKLFWYRELDLKALESNHSFIHSQRKPWIWLGAGVLVCVLLYILFPHIQSPGLHIEDTMQLSDISTGQVDLFKPATYEYYRGYTVFISEWLAAAANLFPISWQPHLYLFLGSLAMVVATLAAARSGIYSSKLVLTIAPTVLFFGAFTDPAFYITLTGVLFSSTALLMAIAFSPPPTSAKKLGCYLFLVCILAFSGPYGSVLLPLSIALLLYFGTLRNVIFLSTIACLSALYILSAESGMVTLSNIFEPDVRMIFLSYLVEHILLLGLFGRVDYSIGIGVIFIAIVPLLIYRKDTLFVKMSLIFIATSLASFISYFLSAKFGQYAGKVISSHTVIAQFCWLLFVLLCVDRFANRLSNKLSISALSASIVVAFSYVIITKQSIVADYVRLLPDPKLQGYLKAVQYAKTHPIKDNDFLQLLHIDRLGFVTSFHRGNGSKPVPESDLPDYVKPFYITTDLQRKQKYMFRYSNKKSVINVSKTGEQIAPIPIIKPKH